MNLKGKSFLKLLDFTPEEITGLLDLAAELKAKISFYSCTVPTYDQYVLAEYLNSGAFERYINRVRRKRRQDRKKLI